MLPGSFAPGFLGAGCFGSSSWPVELRGICVNGSLYNKNVPFALRTVGDVSVLLLGVLHCELGHCEKNKECKAN